MHQRGQAVSEQLIQSFGAPLYEQVHRAIRNRIQSGEWATREPLPGEAMLSRELGVSVGTIRKAMDQLIKENIVVRERGRGTFVKRGAEWRSNSIFRLCTPDGVPITPEIRTVGSSVLAASAADAAVFRVRSRLSGRPSLLKIDREWSHGGRLVCREAILVESDRFPGLVEHADPSAQTFFSCYAEYFRTRIEIVNWSIAAAPAKQDLSADSNLTLCRTSYDARTQVIELCRQTVPLDGVTVQIRR